MTATGNYSVTVTDSAGSELVETGTHRRRAAELTAVRYCEEPGVPRDPEGRGELRRRPTPLVVG